MVNTMTTLQAEYSVIGCLLIEPKIAGELISLTCDDDFTVTELRTIYRAAVKLFTAGRPVDAVTIRGIVGNEYESLLRGCMDITPSYIGWRTYISAMQEQTRVARLRAIGERLLATPTTSEARELLGQANKVLAGKARTRVVGIDAAFARFYEEQDTKRRFVSWGFNKLDSRLYSDYGDFVIIAGRPSAGKTALALQMAAVMAKNDTVGFYSLETGVSKLTNRLVANRTASDFGQINRRALTPADIERIVIWQKGEGRLNLDIVQASGMSVQDVMATALACNHKIVFIDYLQLLRGRGKDRFEQVTNISVDLHTMAQDNRILTVALSQFSRAPAGRADKSPTLTDLRESGQIEQDADVVLALYEDEDENAPAGDRKLRVLKNKEGTLGEFSLSFHGTTQSFAEYMPGELSTARNIKRMEKRHEST